MLIFSLMDGEASGGILKYAGVGDDAWRSILSRSRDESSLNLTSYAVVSIVSVRSEIGVSSRFGAITDGLGSPIADELRVVAGLVKAAGFWAVVFSSLSAMFASRC
jgi:hypothetical protein